MWIVDSTPVECGRSRETVKRSDLAGWAEYGYRASRSRFFWGPRLRLVCTLRGLPVAFALTGAKADERETLLDLLAAEPPVNRARSAGSSRSCSASGRCRPTISAAISGRVSLRTGRNEVASLVACCLDARRDFCRF